MSTINKELAEEIIEADGYYKDDQKVTKVVTYNSRFNNEVSYAIVYGHHDQMKYEKSPACSDVIIIWKAE